MPDAACNYGSIRRDSPPISEIDILWMTAGLGCDGDTIAVTAATQPSIEDIVPGTFPWIPEVKFHNPFLAYENGDEFVRYFRDAAEGRISP
jgi:hydrogenase small subunit